MDDESSIKTAEPPAVVQLRVLVAEAKLGNAEVLPQIRRILHAHPKLGKHFGDLAGQVEAKWIGMLAGNDPCVRESLVRRVDELRAELLGEQTSPLERLLVERVVIGWLMTRYFDAAVSLATEGVPTTQARFLDQQLHRAQKRHTESIRALAKLRKLMP